MLIWIKNSVSYQSSLFACNQFLDELVDLLIIGAGEGRFHTFPSVYGNEALVIHPLLVQREPIVETASAPHPAAGLLDQVYFPDGIDRYAFASAKREVVGLDGHTPLPHFHVFVIIEHLGLQHYYTTTIHNLTS